MAPTLVFKGTEPGDFVMATGSPGGGTIIQYVLKTVVGAVDWNLDAQQATSLVNFGATNSPTTNVDGANNGRVARIILVSTALAFLSFSAAVALLT